MTKLAEIEAAALRLSDKERLQLAGKLLGSVPPPLSASTPDEILAEANRRDAECSPDAWLSLDEFRARTARR